MKTPKEEESEAGGEEIVPVPEKQALGDRALRAVGVAAWYGGKLVARVGILAFGLGTIAVLGAGKELGMNDCPEPGGDEDE